MPQHPCPICGRPVDPATSPAMPFCSERCRQIDLARWLGERYRIPGPVRQPDQIAADQFTEESPANSSSEGPETDLSSDEKNSRSDVYIRGSAHPESTDKSPS